jgi:hypothetical protein
MSARTAEVTIIGMPLLKRENFILDEKRLRIADFCLEKLYL